MILLLGMQLFPLSFGALYFLHSVRTKKAGQSAAVAALLLIQLAVLAVLLWEFLQMP